MSINIVTFNSSINNSDDQLNIKPLNIKFTRHLFRLAKNILTIRLFRRANKLGDFQ